jgi:hypothetical protein
MMRENKSKKAERDTAGKMTVEQGEAGTRTGAEAV